MSGREPLVAGNWKLNGTRASAVALARDVAAAGGGVGCRMVLCPTFLHVGEVRDVLAGSDVALGAQNCSEAQSGAFTGEVSATMLADAGCSHVIVGHSERRALFGETSEQVAAKAQAVQAAGMIPILCVGETLEERAANRIESVVGAQLDALLETRGIESFRDLVVAYEPVWAIGTGESASPEQAQAVHRMIRERIAAKAAATAAALRILYGGSVKPDNAASLFAQPDIDGGLIGGAALDASAFLAICRAAGAAVGSAADGAG